MNKYLLWFINTITLIGSIVMTWALTSEYPSLGIDLYSTGILIWTVGLLNGFVTILSLGIYKRNKK